MPIRLRGMSQITQIDHPSGNGGETRSCAQEFEQLATSVAEKAGQGVGAEQVEPATHQGGDNQTDDLAVKLRTNKKADGQVSSGKTEARQIAAKNRTPVELAQN